MLYDIRNDTNVCCILSIMLHHKIKYCSSKYAQVIFKQQPCPNTTLSQTCSYYRKNILHTREHRMPKKQVNILGASNQHVDLVSITYLEEPHSQINRAQALNNSAKNISTFHYYRKNVSIHGSNAIIEISRPPQS